MFDGILWCSLTSSYVFSASVLLGLLNITYMKFRTLGPVSTGMGDRPALGGYTITVCNQPTRLTQPAMIPYGT